MKAYQSETVIKRSPSQNSPLFCNFAFQNGKILHSCNLAFQNGKIDENLTDLYLRNIVPLYGTTPFSPEI